MGVDIGDLGIKHTISLQSLAGKTIAIDAFNILYQFLASIRQEDGMPLMDFKGRITAHLSGLFYRTSRMMENNIKPIYVFDGKPPIFKRRTSDERAKNKQEAEEKWRRALEEERFEDAKKYAQATSRLTEEMVEESKQLLNGMGIPYLQAPSEGEAQASVLVQKGLAYATASQDYDSLLFGSPRLVRNLSITGKRKVPRQDRYVIIEPEEIVLDEMLKSLSFSREQLILLGILIGTDFNEGIRGVGPKTALRIVSQVKDLKQLEDFVYEKYHYEFEADIAAIVKFFLEPPSVEVKTKFQWGAIDAGEVERILVKEHDFSSERVGNAISNLQKHLKEKNSQSRLEEWL